MAQSLAGTFLRILIQFRGKILLASIMILISNVLLIINPLILRQALFALDPVETKEIDGWSLFFNYYLGSYFHTIAIWAFLLFSISIISAIFKYGMRIIFLSISRQIELEIREKIFGKIQMQSRAFFDRHGVGDLLSRLTNDITAYRDMLGPGLMYPMFFISMLVPAFIALIYLSPLLAAVSAVPIFVIYLINLWVRKPLFKISEAVQVSLADMSQMTHEYFSGVKLIKSYGIEQSTCNRFKKLCLSFSRLNIQFATFQGMFFPALILVTKIITVLLVMMAASIVLLDWEYSLTMPDFISFMWIQSYVFSPLLMLAWIIPIYQKGSAAYSRLLEIYHEPIEVYEDAHPKSALENQADIKFNSLTFYYPNHSYPILSNFNLQIKAGTFIGITGPVGSGKSTIFRLLNREYEVPHGSILIGNQDIHHYKLEVFHQDMLLVEQSPFLFSKSIGDNIRFGKLEASQVEINAVSEQADLHHDVLELPHQYETMVGERGVSLSGGQKQRVAIARAFLVNRSIFLFDDIFSAVDFATEKKIFQAIKRKFAGKTVLLITHRISVLEQMDRVIYLKNGSVIEDGTPEELMKLEGLYRNLVNLHKKIDE